MISCGWIISHRCSWIMIYVLCCNAQMNLIVIFMTYTCILYFVNFPSVSCLPSMLYLYGETPLLNYGPPVHSFTFILPSTTNIVYFLQVLFYFTANKYLFPYYTSNPLFLANQWDWQPHCKLGQSSLVVLCAGSTLMLALTTHKTVFWRAVKSQLATTFRSDFFLLLVD
jgi:hypothetical protein